VHFQRSQNGATKRQRNHLYRRFSLYEESKILGHPHLRGFKVHLKRLQDILEIGSRTLAQCPFDPVCQNRKTGHCRTAMSKRFQSSITMHPAESRWMFNEPIDGRSE